MVGARPLAENAPERERKGDRESDRDREREIEELTDK